MFQISAVILFLFLFDITSANISAIFIFGDSIVDVGNNIYINTVAKATFPNGIDFCRAAPSGRFTNGRTVIDVLEEDLGVKNFTPPYLDPTTAGDVVLTGVNYASSGSGILNNTGIVWWIKIEDGINLSKRHTCRVKEYLCYEEIDAKSSDSQGDHISFDEQISNFEKTKETIVSRIGRREAKKLLKHQAFFVVVIGTNDLLLQQQAISLQNLSSHGQRAYLKNLTPTFKSQLTRLYHLEARRFVVANIPRIGCSPFERDKYPNEKGCVGALDKAIQSYNRRLKHLLTDLTANQTGSTYVYADIHAILEDILQNYKSYGFENADSACCHSAGAHGGLIPCFSLSKFCSDRTKYVFWDAFHLTETSNVIAASHMMDGGLNYMSPMNVRQLVHSGPVHRDSVNE